ncbi:MAG: tRNA (adenosine(37)-N6)-threonylcarbamoyltransferase complex ATPase subunit type 1 TsaE [Rhodobiaceae bacterium]|nr:tRNA (adenosine(37)-N6)-threonylcarbamoyltransferase complex ATPase subunit type 1 TsaE [Rhodobiaceae bacterium]
MYEIIINSPNVQKTEKLGKILSKILKKNDLIALQGELGSGKTTLARSIIWSSMDTKKSSMPIPSPTFNLVQLYDCEKIIIGHADLYRINNSEEIEALNLEEIIDNGVLIVEWAEKLSPIKESNILRIQFINTNNGLDINILNVSGWSDRIIAISKYF